MKMDFANDYINKTFDIVFRISPPIMSDWKAFFKKCWDEAFVNGGDSKELIRVEQIYETHANVITPREIIAFINEIISVKLIHMDIPERYIALFVINKDVILANPLEAITKAEFLRGLEYLYKDTDDFQKYITALAYQISSENALEVIYRKQLKDCLVNNNVDRFNEVSRTNVFDKIVSSVLSELDNFEKPILTLAKLRDDANVTENEKQLLWDDIYLKTMLEKSETIFLNDSQKILFVKVSTQHKKPWIEKLLTNMLNNTTQFSSSKYAQLVDELNKLSVDNSFGINIYDLLPSKRVQVEDFITLVKEKEKEYVNYNLSVTEQELDQYHYNLEIEQLQDIEYLKSLIPAFSLKLFEESLKDKVLANTSDIVKLETLYKVLEIISVSHPPIGLLLEDRVIYSIFVNTSNDRWFYYDLIAMRLARGTNFSPSYSGPLSNILETADENIANMVSNRIRYYIDLSDFLLTSISFTTNLSKLVAKKITSDISINQWVNVSNLIQKFDVICSTNELSAQTFLTSLSRCDSPVFNKALIESIPIFYFENTTTNNSRLAIESKKALINYFDDLSKEEWAEVFKDLNEDKFKLTEIIGYSNWNSHSLEALKELLRSSAKNGIIVNGAKLSQLLQSFEKAKVDLTNTFKNIRDEFILGRNINSALFAFFGPWLFKYASLVERAGDVMRTILTVDLLDEETCINLLIKDIDTVKQLITRSPQSETSDFKDGIRDRFGNEIIKDLAKALDIRKKKLNNEIIRSETSEAKE